MLATKNIRHMAIPSFDEMHLYTAIIFKSATKKKDQAQNNPPMENTDV